VIYARAQLNLTASHKHSADRNLHTNWLRYIDRRSGLTATIKFRDLGHVKSREISFINIRKERFC